MYQDEEDRKCGGECFGYLIIGLGLFYVVNIMLFQNGQLDVKACQGGITWIAQISIILILFGVYIVLMSYKFRFLEKVYIGYLFKFKELLGIALGVYSLYIGVSLLFVNYHNCYFVEMLLKLYVYTFWGIVVLIFLIGVILIINIFSEENSTSGNQEGQYVLMNDV